MDFYIGSCFPPLYLFLSTNSNFSWVSRVALCNYLHFKSVHPLFPTCLLSTVTRVTPCRSVRPVTSFHLQTLEHLDCVWTVLPWFPDSVWFWSCSWSFPSCQMWHQAKLLVVCRCLWLSTAMILVILIILVNMVFIDIETAKRLQRVLAKQLVLYNIV